MIKKIIVSFCLLFSVASAAQEGTASPYSYYGIGDVRFKGTAENRAMGGLGILNDSIHINLQNPAAYSALKLTTFTVGGSHSTTNFRTNSAAEKATRTTVDYLAIAFPAGKFGVGFGLIPYSSVGYKIRNIATDSETASRQYTGEGGMNKVFLGAGYSITKNFSFGVDMNYNFGNVETKNLYSVPGVYLGTRELNTSDLSGFNVNLGLIYNAKINKKYDFLASVTYTPESNLKSVNERKIATVLIYTDREELADSERTIDVGNSDLTLPSKLAFGAGFGEKKQWFVGAEVTLQKSSEFGSRFNDISNISYEDSKRFSLGGYFTPNINSYSSYFQKITYRAGLRYENTGLVVSNTAIKDYGMSLGLGLPVGGIFSSLNVGFEYGRRGTTGANLVKEIYGNVFVSLSLSDRWFVKRKYE